MELTKEMERGLLKLLRFELPEEMDVYLEEGDYQKINFRVYNENVMQSILKKFKFVDIGNVYDYQGTLPQPEVLDGYDVTNNYDMFQRIAVSEKLNSIVFYGVNRFSISANFLVDIDKIKKFSKQVKGILQQDSNANMFQDIDFTVKKREFIEISDPTGETMKPADVVKKQVPKETLVFEEGTTITEVMGDISTFFDEKTKGLYDRMKIAYKRGIILYGDPGNGKSAMIREIIRRVPKIVKIVINPNVDNVTKILSSLISSLEGRSAIIIIEDIDSLITHRNRSEFLNILDGVDVKSGVYFIGTTNYPESIDPAFMNRSGRFDRTYEIGNPAPITRKAFFESREIGELVAEYKTYKDDSIPDSNEGVIDLFVEHSDDLPMASLKEVMTGTQYALASNPDTSVEEALITVTNRIKNIRDEHKESHAGFKANELQVLGGGRGGRRGPQKINIG